MPGEKFTKESNEISNETIPVKKLYLNSSDDLYIDLRDKHVNALGSILSRTAKSIHAQFDVSFNTNSNFYKVL